MLSFLFCFVCVNVTPEMLSISSASISLNHYHKPPWYSGEIALGSGFQCLTRYSALPTLPWCVGMDVLYVHLQSYTHFLCIPAALAVKIQIQWCQWNKVFLLKKCMYLCVCKTELQNKLWFYAALSHAEDPFHLMPHPQRTAVRPWRAQSVPCSPNLQQFQYSMVNNPNISHKIHLEVLSQCYHTVI